MTCILVYGCQGPNKVLRSDETVGVAFQISSPTWPCVNKNFKVG